MNDIEKEMQRAILSETEGLNEIEQYTINISGDLSIESAATACYEIHKREMEKQWISVKDRLPEKFVNVLALGSMGSYVIAFCDATGELDLYPLREEGEVFIYWMPLPLVPQS